MSASPETITGHLERIERALTERLTQPVRSLSVNAVVALTGIPRRAVLAAIRSGGPALDHRGRAHQGRATRRPGRLAGAPRHPVLTTPERSPPVDPRGRRHSETRK